MFPWIYFMMEKKMSPDIKLIKVGTSFKEQNVEYIYIGFSKWCKKTYDKEKYDYIYESVELTPEHIKELKYKNH